MNIVCCDCNQYNHENFASARKTTKLKAYYYACRLKFVYNIIQRR